MRRNARTVMVIVTACAGLLAPGSVHATFSHCAHVEANCTHRLAATFGTVLNEFDKFKWDFMRRLDDLGTDASEEERQDLAEIFCTKFEIRERIYKKRLGVAVRDCRNLFESCTCGSVPPRGRADDCRRGYRANVYRRAGSYKAMLHAAVWECCTEVRNLAEDRP